MSDDKDPSDMTVDEFLQNYRDTEAQYWDRENKILGAVRKARDLLRSNVLFYTNPVGRELDKLLEQIEEEQEKKIEHLEESIDEFDEFLGER